MGSSGKTLTGSELSFAVTGEAEMRDRHGTPVWSRRLADTVPLLGSGSIAGAGGARYTGAYSDGTIVTWNYQYGIATLSGDGRTMLLPEVAGVVRLDIRPQSLADVVCRQVAVSNLSRASWRHCFPGQPYHATCKGLPMPPDGA